MHSRFLRRTVAAAAMLCITVSLLPAAFAFDDVSTSTRYRAAIEALQQKGIVEGYSDGTFQPLSRINRAEFSKIIAEIIAPNSNTLENCRLPSTRQVFADVPRSAWFFPYVCALNNQNIVQGYPDGLFHPELDINFVEAGKMFALAFKQQVQGADGEWYEQYARALESSKAIPPTIAKLDAKLTRGEMAEMLWRLTEERTDQETKGYLNVKYPEVAINLASDEPQFAKSCTDLKVFTEEVGARQTMYMQREIMLESADDAGAPAPTAPSTGNAGEKAVDRPQSGGGSDGDYSQTNVQVEGVDEADIVKTDGQYLYVVRNAEKSTVRIVDVNPAASLKEVATISMGTGEDAAYAQDLYIDGNTLIVIAQRSFYHILPAVDMPMFRGKIAPGYYPYQQYQPRTDVKIYDVSDRQKPVLKRGLSFDGTSVSTRRIGGKLYVVLNQPPIWKPLPPRPLEADLLPQVEDSKTGKTAPVTRCDSVMILPHIPQPQYLTVGVIDTKNVNAEVKSAVVLGSAENVYSSLENLYVAATEWTYSWNERASQSHEKTNLYRFQFTDTGIELQAQGEVPGHLLNQFSMDESKTSFRVATTISDQWRPDGTTIPSQNNIYVLNMNMETAGKITEIAPGEQIYSVRFLGDRAYMVTFRKIDPFFVIDLKDPRNPKILGKLKIPGYSDYLHPYDQNHVIGFGKEAVESKQGDFAWYQGMKMAIFDVTDVENPKELHKEVIGDRGTESPLLHNHKALLFEKDRNLLAFPVTVMKVSDEAKAQNPDGSAYGSQVFQGAYVYDLTLKDGFTLRGTITHMTEEDMQKAGDYWYGYGKDIERIVRSGTSLLTVSQNGVQAHGEEDVKKQGEMTFTK